MYRGQTVFSQLMQFVPWMAFSRIVARYNGDRGVRNLNCAQQFRAMAFAQLTRRRSLRDLVACLDAVPAKLYHAGFTAPISFSTLARANERRSWHIYEDLAQRLIARARPLYADEDLGLNLDDTVYALDSSTVDLCLSVFGWAPFRTTKAAVKLHTLLDLRGSLPSFIHVSDGKLHDVKALDLIVPELGAIYVMDRAYVDFERLFRLHQAGASFVTRAKKNLTWHRVYSSPKNREHGIQADQLIALDGKRAQRAYPLHLRRIRYQDPDSGKRLKRLSARSQGHLTLPCASASVVGIPFYRTENDRSLLHSLRLTGSRHAVKDARARKHHCSSRMAPDDRRHHPLPPSRRLEAVRQARFSQRRPRRECESSLEILHFSRCALPWPRKPTH